VKLETVPKLVALVGVVACAINLAAARPPAIGTAIVTGSFRTGSFRVDGATVAGNATLFDAATIETHQVSSSLDLASGPHLLLGTDSKGQIFGDRLVLEHGSIEMHNAAGFRVEARGLTVRTENGRGAVRILLAGNTRVQVAALVGAVRVLNSHGLLETPREVLQEGVLREVLQEILSRKSSTDACAAPLGTIC
jgi:hypothetical protein